MKFIINALVLLFIPSCQFMAKNYIPEPIFSQNMEQSSYIVDGKIDLSKLNLDNYKGSINTGRRNSLIAQIMQLSDDRCELHKATIVSNANAWNIGMTSASLLFTGFSSLVSHAQTAADLAAAATGTIGLQAVVNKEVYADALSTTIIRAIDEGRKIKRATIDLGMGNPDYDVSIALLDLQDYHSRCSLMAGLVEVTKALENRQPTRSEVVLDLNLIREQIANIEASTALSQSQRDTAKQTLSDALLKKTQQLYNVVE